VHTGQHYDENMTKVFFEELDVAAPKYNLGIHSNRHGSQTGRMLEAIEGTLTELRPNCVLVFGDTNSTLAGALAAAKLHIPVAHVEAGLRCFNRQVPKEINRICSDHVSDFLFAPTETAVNNLLTEGISSERIHRTGDVMYDAALFYGSKASPDVLPRGVEPNHYVLATIHRAENTDNPERLSAIMEGLASVAGDVPVVLPLHPRSRAAVEKGGTTPQSKHLHVIDPVGYLRMIALEKLARLIVTDSGGVQKEAFFYRVPCVILRDQTEWTELVELGWNVIVPPISASAVAGAIFANLDRRGREAEPYGDGTASSAIATILYAAFQ
jgi:UDP-GlcNAc3NAcA epimerase